MGIFDDLQRLKQQGDEVAAASGRPARMTDRIASLPGDLAYSADLGAYARSITSRPTTDVSGWVPGTARLDRFHATGALLGMDPVAEVDLEVTVAGAQPYRTSTQLVVPYPQLVFMTAGRILDVAIDPADRSRIVLMGART